jgi:hypothetical protein
MDEALLLTMISNQCSRYIKQIKVPVFGPEHVIAMASSDASDTRHQRRH